MSAINLRANAAALRVAEAKIAAVVDTLGKAWDVRLAYDPSPRRPYPTLKPRTGPAPKQIDNSTLGSILQANGRDFYKLTPDFTRHLQREMVTRFAGKGVPNASALMMSIAAAYKKYVIERMLHQGAPDVRLPENSAKWTQYKSRLGLSTQKGRASGQLVAATQKARAEIQRRR